MYENVAVPYEIHWKVCLDVGSKPTGSIEVSLKELVFEWFV